VTGRKTDGARFREKDAPQEKKKEREERRKFPVI